MARSRDMVDDSDNGSGADELDDRDTVRRAQADFPTEDGVPIITCMRCDREFRLDYELEELSVGNRAVEQFALDHHRHTGHYPDDVTPWQADCRVCPAIETFLAEGPTERFARTHARHTNHSVSLVPPEGSPALITPPSE